MTIEKRARPIQMKFRVDRMEQDAIMRRKKESGIKNFGVFARQLLVNGQLRVVDFSTLKNLRVEINKIGVNVNQIAKQVNEQDEASHHQVVACLDQLNQLKELLENVIEQEIRKEE